MKKYILVYDHEGKGYCPTYFKKDKDTNKYGLCNCEFDVPSVFSETEMQSRIVDSMYRGLSVIQAEHLNDIWDAYYYATFKYKEIISGENSKETDNG